MKPKRTIKSLSIVSAAPTPSRAKLGAGAADYTLTILVAAIVLVPNGPELDDVATIGDTSTVTGAIVLVDGEVPWQAGDARGVMDAQLRDLVDEVPDAKAAIAGILLACAAPGALQVVEF